MSDNWTRPSALPPFVRVHDGIERGVVLHFAVRPEDVTRIAVDLMQGLTAIVDVPAETRIGVATRLKTITPSRTVLLSDLTQARFEKLCDAGDAFFTGALGSSRIDVQATKGRRTWWSLAATVSVPESESDRPQHLLELADLISNIDNSAAEFLSGGADIQPHFDSQEFCVFPLNRANGKLPSVYDQEKICGYYWLTFLGRKVRAQLGPAPVGLDVIEHDCMTEIRLSTDPSEDAVIRSRIPELRRWLRPVLPGWMVGREPGFAARLYEGPVVPTAVAMALDGLAAGRFGLPEPAEAESKFSLPAGSLESASHLHVSLVASSPTFSAMAHDGLKGAVAALDRGLKDGWLEGDEFDQLTTDGLAIHASGTSRSLQLLLFVLSDLLVDFYKATRDGPVTILQLDTVTVG